LDVFEAMGSCRAMRYFTDEPVSDELIDKLIWAATRAPSPGNSQHYGFVVVRDKTTLGTIGKALTTALEPVSAAPPPDEPWARAMITGTLDLAADLASLPALIVVGGPSAYPPGRPSKSFVWSALYPAVQNLLVAARALGLGTTLTTWHLLAGPTLREQLAIPDDIHLGAVIPVGWPAREFGPVRRRPIEQFIHRERWTSPAPTAAEGAA
jgi:nitroreductase